MKRLVVIFVWLIFACNGVSAFTNNQLDSLEVILPTMPEDSLKAEVYSDLAYKYRHTNPKKAEQYIEKAIIISQKQDFENLFCKALSIKSVINYFQGNYELGLGYAMQAEQIASSIKDYRRLCYVYNDIGNIYFFQKEYSKAIEYYKKALDIANEKNYKDRVAIGFNNLGEVEKSRENYEIALDYQVKAMETRKSMNISYAMNIHNIGTIYYFLGNYERALKFLLSAQNMIIDEDNKEVMLIENQLYYGKTMSKMGLLDSAEYYLKRSIEISKEQNNREYLKSAYFDLSNLKKAQGKTDEALAYQDEYIKVKRELEENSELLSIISEYEQKQKEKEIKVLQDQQKLQEAELEAKRIGQYAFGTIALLLSIFISYGYNRFKIIRKQKNLIVRQKENIEEKQKNFLHSLDYASVIQRSILPLRHRLDKSFDDHFVFFQPLHTVSGDFYYFMEKEDRIYISVADCTGHGVPGAFMSMIGYEIMNYIINTMNVVEPNRILARVNDRIYNTLKQDAKNGLDGMDIALACIYKGKNKMDLASAGSNVFIYNKNREGEVLQLDKNKFGVGSKFNRDVKYTQQTIDLLEGDVIFMSSDGYVDQFGGPKGKKFKITQLKELMMNIYQKSGNEQYDEVKKTFFSWKEGFEQIDDVTVLGFKPKLVSVKQGELDTNQMMAINTVLDKLLQIDIEIDITEAIELLDEVDIPNKQWREFYEELTEVVLSMDKETLNKRIKEILEDL